MKCWVAGDNSGLYRYDTDLESLTHLELHKNKIHEKITDTDIHINAGLCQKFLWLVCKVATWCHFDIYFFICCQAEILTVIVI